MPTDSELIREEAEALRQLALKVRAKTKSKFGNWILDKVLSFCVIAKDDAKRREREDRGEYHY